jgi:hypothetical protein
MAEDLIKSLRRLTSAMTNDIQDAQSQTAQLTTALEQQRQSKTALITILNTGAASGQAAAGQSGAQALPVTPHISATAVESIPNFESWVKRLPTILRQFCGKSSRGRKFDKSSAYPSSIKKIHEDSFGLAGRVCSSNERLATVTSNSGGLVVSSA